jgi:Tfp pilus assembly protein PilZ
LSLGGACLAISEIQPIGTKVVLFLTLPGTDAQGVEVEGEVAWCNDIEPRDIGIRFLSMHDRAHQLLVRYIEVQLDLGAEPED